MSGRLQAALADCLEHLRRGATLEECLAHYPEQASELRGLLLLAEDVRQVPAPRGRTEAKAAGERRMLAAAARLRAPASRPHPLARLWASLTSRPALRWRVALLTAVTLVVAGGWFSVAASAHSLPGDLLYPVKRASEQVQMWLTVDEAEEQQLEAEFVQERLEETRRVLDRGRETVVEFEGELGETTAEYWLVGGLAVELSAESRVEGEPVVGAWVQVRAESRGDGRLLALGLRVGGVRRPRPAATATPRPTRTVTPTATPAPTRTPVPALEPTRLSTRTRSPVQLPGKTPQTTKPPPTRPTRTPEPYSVPPTRTPEPSPTPPTRTPKPSPTVPTRTPKPSPTAPTRTPDPSVDRPTRTPRPTLDPSSTADVGLVATPTRRPRHSPTPTP